MKIKLWLIFFALILFCPSVDAAGGWQELKSEHFIVFFASGEDDFAAEVSDRAEEYYNSIADDLGYVRYANFWKWDNRVKIFIFPDHAAYLGATGEQQWSHGIADYHKKTIISYVWSNGFLSSLLPHELAHLIFRDFVGFKGEVPLWLDEGVAQWEERALKSARNKAVLSLAQSNTLLSLNVLMSLDIRKVKNDENLRLEAAGYNADASRREIEISGNALVRVYYLQAFSLVGFLIETYSAENFLIFCRQLRDGKNIAEALRFAYPQDLRGIDELEKKWGEYVFKNAG